MNNTDPTGLDAVFSFPEGSSPSSSPGYLGINANAEVERTQDFLDGVVQGEEQDHMFAQFQAFAMMDMASDIMGAVAPQMDDVTASASYGFSLRLGIVRNSGGLGVAYDFVTGKVEFFRVGGLQGGVGAGGSIGLGFSIGDDKLGNFGGFNGPSNNLDFLGLSHGLIGGSWNPNYGGLNVAPPGELPPFNCTQYGREFGLFYGKTNTIQMGPTFSLPSVTTLHF